MEYGNYFKDAFQKLSLLEQDFDISVDAGKTDELATFIADDREAIPEEPVFDTAAEKEDELQDNYVGKVIIECECCHSKFYKEPEDVIIDSETQLANIEDECPFCNATMGYTVIGKIEPFDEEEPTEDEVEIEVDDEVVEPEETPEEEEVEGEEETEEEEGVQESLRNKIIKKRLKEGVLSGAIGGAIGGGLTGGPAGAAAGAVTGAVSGAVDDLFDEALAETDEEEEEVEESFNVGKFRRKLNEKRKACKDDDCKVVSEFLDDEDEEKPLEECGDNKLTEGVSYDAQRFAEWYDNCRDWDLIDKIEKVMQNYPDRYDEDVDVTFDKLPKKVQAQLLSIAGINESLTEADEYPKSVLLRDKKHAVRVFNKAQEEFLLSHTPEEVVKAADEWEKDYQKAQMGESLTEDFKDVSITTDDQHLEMTSDESGKVTVTTEPLMEDSITDEPLDSEGGQEEIAPLSDEDVSEIVAQSEEAADEENEDEEIATEDEVEFEEPEAAEDGEEEEFDEFDEESFDQMGESYMRKVYDNIKSYKTTSVKESGDTLIVEGLITFTSGNTKKTTYTFSNPKMLKGDKVVLEGFNKTFSKTKKAFSLKGKIEDKKFITESLGYNYITKKLNESVRVTGRVKRILV